MPQVKINTKAASFELDDFRGSLVRLSNYLHQKNVLLVFNRGFL